MNYLRFNELDNLHIVYPGASGGNHLKNMISLCNEFEPNFVSDNYEQELLNLYIEQNKIWIEVREVYDKDVSKQLNSAKAHFSTYHQSFDAIDFTQPTDKKLIIAGHFHDYYSAIENDLIKKIETAIWIILPFPKKNSIPYLRAMRGGWWPQHEHNYVWPFSISTNSTSIIKVDDNNGFKLQPELLFTESGSQYLRELLSTHFNISLPKFADNLHEIWYNWMKAI